MKKLKIIFGIIIAVVFVIAIIFLIKFATKSETTNEKPISEVRYLDSELTEMINAMNNVSTENYKVSITKLSTSKENGKSSNSQSSGQESSGGESGGNGQQAESGGQSEESSSPNSNSGEQYELEGNGVLSNSTEKPEWDELKTKVENLYSLIPTATIDLYSSNVEREKILNFNKELDNLVIAVKEENKDNSLQSLAKLYSYLPEYLEKLSNDNIYKAILKTKSNVINAYAIIDTNNWNEIAQNIKLAIDSYSTILNNISSQSKEYAIDRGYIILNELNNAVSLQDREVFLIKYKYLIDEF